MNVIEALNSRHSTRSMKPDPVSKDTIIKILEAAARAPSWGNTQPWELFVAAGEPLERLRKAFLANFQQGIPGHQDLARPQQWPATLQKRQEENGAARFSFIGVAREDKAARQAMSEWGYQFYGAPAMVYLCMNKTLSPWSIFDMGMIMQSIMLAAVEYGVATMPATGLVAYPDLLRAELGIPDDLMVLFALGLGYADPQKKINDYRSARRSLDEVVRWKGI